MRQRIGKAIPLHGRQLPVARMQTVKRIGRFDIGPGLPEPLFPKESDPPSWPAETVPSRYGNPSPPHTIAENGTRREAERPDKYPEATEVSDHSFASFHTVDKSFFFEVERIGIVTAEPESAGRISTLQFVLTASESRNM